MYDFQRGIGASVTWTTNAPVRGSVALALLLCGSRLRSFAETPFDWLGDASRMQTLAHWSLYCA